MIANAIVLTTAQKDAAVATEQPYILVGPRAIDNAYPGVGININPLATDYAAGDVIDLSGGKWYVPQCMCSHPDYVVNEPLMAILRAAPWCIVDSDTIFAYVEPI